MALYASHAVLLVRAEVLFSCLSDGVLQARWETVQLQSMPGLQARTNTAESLSIRQW